MEIQANKVIEKLLGRISELELENTVLKLQIETKQDEKGKADDTTNNDMGDD